MDDKERNHTRPDEDEIPFGSTLYYVYLEAMLSQMGYEEQMALAAWTTPERGWVDLV